MAAAEIDSGDDLLAMIFLLSLAVVGVAVWLITSVPAKVLLRGMPVAPASRPGTGTGAAGKAAIVVSRRTPARRRRVILLHSITPGQSPHEYNVGDNQGTRGSALVRAA